MSSRTTILETRRRRKHRKSGHKRKVQTARRSTLSYQELFGALGEPSAAQDGSSASAVPGLAKAP